MIVAESAMRGSITLGSSFKILGYVDQSFFYGFGHNSIGVKSVLLIPVSEYPRKDLQNICADQKLVSGALPIPLVKYLDRQPMHVNAFKISFVKQLLRCAIGKKGHNVFEFKEGIVIKIKYPR